MKKSRKVIELIELIELLSHRQRQTLWIALDFFVYVLVWCLRVLVIPTGDIISPLYVISISFVLFIILSERTQARKHIARYGGVALLIKLFVISVVSQVLGHSVFYLISGWFSVRFFVSVTPIIAVFTVALRVLWQQLYITNFLIKSDKKRRIVVLGAGDGGAYFVNFFKKNSSDVEIVGILDKNKQKHGQYIEGIPVLGDRTMLPILKSEGIEEVVIAMPSLKTEMYEELLSECNALGMKVYKMPKIESVMHGVVSKEVKLAKFDIADLLNREEIVLDQEPLTRELEGKTLLVTGAGGSIGSEIVRQISKFNPKRVVLLGHGENSIYQIYHEMIQAKKMIEYVPVIADIQDYDRLLKIFEQEKPAVVYHAAAHKHVPLMERNPEEAYKNNVLGTYNVARAVHHAHVKKMVMISTDKAVNPPNVMGASKRIAELIVTGIAQVSDSVFCAVRFGNVLGSRGSVIPVFENQIAAGGPVTVTDFRMTRYFMTIPEASRLVIYAGAFATTGEIFVLDMGEAVKIVDLAKKMILLSGNRVEDIGIVESGIRPGEKLYEELMLTDESTEKKIQEKIFVGRVMSKSLDAVEEFIQELRGKSGEELKDFMIAFANDRYNKE